MFHVEVRQFPHVARAFNLSEAELKTRVLVPWVRGHIVKLGEREWEPKRARLTIIEGREVGADELGLGRGWANASRGAENVTDRVLAAAAAESAPGVPPATGGVPAFKEIVKAQCTGHRLAVHQVMWLANSRHPELRASERLALAEQAVWELLHEGGLTLLRRAEGDEFVAVEREEWQPALLSWATWSEPPTPRWYISAAG